MHQTSFLTEPITPHPRTLARRDGPDSSELAAERIIPKLPKSYALVLEAMRKFGRSCTVRELSNSGAH